mmetsp:Transcript_96123/g.170577  ORF Transcript_96123/g.170577 Transcript_96123/m.170577 type:complete len:951 (+) Transcript_96123:63-2915(+)|eukprot:CAMPEP_0197655332 /NCGR_PEP_ID=MMETSP1338-20131121/39388_1 /TAXON_ID=43686 ORGANISM="Pelagodinium beii, Strain RCC1491" /NCGR_SAMPLE_ID=MMETSP1338 /ASSEMBLY_ACC=CAM_ASM_000754 /LENGTH=950 /DNA_ID=CAMNT_0043230959 /DNA_START=58 /DNA_END=2910 /DNA_ORIENTATION=-
MDGYQEFLLTVRRDINCLTDTDRAVRRGAVVKLEKTLLTSAKIDKEYVRRVFLEELHKPLFRMYADQGEKCRELSISMTLRFLDIVQVEDLENLLPLLLAALLGRLRSIPFPEQSEELRLEVLRLLSHLFDVCKELLNPFASDILDALSKALTDSCPDAKKECCEITKKVSQHFDAERVSRAGGPLVGSLLANLRHQQWKVRRATMDSLGAFLMKEAPMLDHMEDVLPHLNAMLSDRTPSVRQSLAETLERWLIKGLAFKVPTSTNFDDDGPEGFDKFESRLLTLLLGVAADEDAEQVGTVALGALERVAAAKHEARKKRAAQERDREEARRKAKEAREAKGGYNDPAAEEAAKAAEPQLATQDPEVVPEFDYASVLQLLPAPFVAGRLPSALTTTYIKLHLSSILPGVLANITQWTSDIRESAARVLQVILVLANKHVAPFLDAILVHLYKALGDDAAEVSKKSLQCAAMVGAFLDADLVLDLVGKHLGLKLEGGSSTKSGTSFDELWPQDTRGRQTTRTVQDVGMAVKSFQALAAETRRHVFAVLSQLLLPNGLSSSSSSRQLKDKDVKMALRFMEEGAQTEELLPFVLRATESLLHAGGTGCVNEWPRVFDLLLRMRSGEECKPEVVDANMDHLAKLLSRSRRELYEEHLRSRLDDLLKDADALLWEERSPNRHILETLLRNAGPAVSAHIGSLMPVLARQSHPEDASAPARVDLLGLVHFLINEEEESVSAALSEHSMQLMNGVLIPNCSWRPGQSNLKIRKGGMVCVHAMLRRHLVPPAVLNEAFADLLPILKSCLDDNWSPDNRMVACLVLSCILTEMQADINGEQLREIYPELLKRLDDSNDKIRVAVCEALGVFFKCLPHNWSRTLFEYILRTLFVHLDDPNMEIQNGIYAVLESAVHQDYTTFMNEAKTAAAKSSHPRLCEELVRLAESLRKASGEDGAMD